MDAVHGLVERARGGDQEAFGALVQMYQQRLYGVVYRFVRNPEDAQELTQVAWVKAWKKLDSFKARSEFFTWLYRVAAFVCLDYLRSRRRRKEEVLEDAIDPPRDPGAVLAASSNPRPDHQVARAEIREIFDRALEDLSPEHRMALVLREVEGKNYEEIAEVMGCRKGTVMSRIFYARKHMQEAMRDVR